MWFQTYPGRVMETVQFLRSREWLLILCFVAILTSSGMGLTNPILSIYVQDFGVSTSLVGFFITTFAVGRILITMPAGRAADRWSRKILMVTGILIITVGSLGLAIASNYHQLVISRFLQGVGSGLYTSAAFLIIADLSPPSERGRNNSLYQGGILLGLTLSPTIGGFLASTIDIRAPLFAHTMLAILVGIILYGWFPHSLGTIDLDQSEPGATLKEMESPETGGDEPDQYPVPGTREILSDRHFLLIALAAFLIFVARAGSRDTLMPLIGKDELRLDTTALGFVFTLISLCNLVMIPVAGFISDTRGRKPAVLLGLTLSGIALLVIGISSSYEWFLVGAVLMGSGKGLGETSSIVYVTDISPRGRHGTAFGLFLTLRDLGLFLGPVLLSWIADLSALRIPFIINGLAMLGVTGLFYLFARETLHVTASSNVTD